MRGTMRRDIVRGAQGYMQLVRMGLFGVLALTLSGCRCSEEAGPGTSVGATEVTVLRVESLSPENPGAEHCDERGQKCSPLAPQQKLPAKGLVRTFAGGKVSLDFGGGRRVDLDGLSETRLKMESLSLTHGQFSLESTPLVEKENVRPLRFTARGKTLSTSSDVTTTANVSVAEQETLLTVRRGQVSGIDIPDMGKTSPQAGQSVRLSDSGLDRTGIGGQELPPLPFTAPRADEFGGLLAARESTAPRGLGTMSARLPSTDQVRDGVVLKKHHVKVVIRDGFARTEVEEEFENTTPHVLEGRYRFPVPADASLSRLALWVGDELIEGEVLERQRAADIYKSIVDRPVPRDPALLEWVTGGEMSLKVFPIVPKKSRTVVLAYNQALSTENGTLRYVYPLSLGQGRENTLGDLSISVHMSDTRAKLRNLRVPNYDARLGHEGNFQTVSLELKGATPTRDFVVLADRDAEPSAQLSAYVHAWGPAPSSGLESPPTASALPPDVKGHFALRVSADLPPGTERPVPLPQDRAIVLDVSQSQSKETIAAEAALAYGILREMDPSERFVLLACDSACRTFPENGPGVASDERLRGALSFLTGLDQGGSSDLAGSLVAASAQLRGVVDEGRSRQVILLSDGNASSGELSAETIARRVRPIIGEVGVDLRHIGAGRTLDEDTLRGLADELDATYDRLQSGTGLEARIFELSISLRRPVLRKVHLSLPPTLRTVAEMQLPALRLGQEVIVTGELLDLVAGEAVLEGSLEGFPYRLARKITWEATSEVQNPLIPRLWAQERIASLQAKEATPDIQAEIIRLSTEHRTMSRYTSFLVLESEQMYKDFGVARTTRTESDQPEAAFSQLDRDMPAERQRAEEDAERLTSFEALDDVSGQKKGEASAAKVASSAQFRPRSAPKPTGARKPTSMADASDSLDLGRSGTRGSGSGAGPSPSAPVVSSPESERAVPKWEEFPEELPVFRPSPQFFPPPPSRRQAHLVFQQADDEWRKWGEKNLLKLAESLQEDDQSRARHEAYIRGHLKHGRFPEARRDALRFVELDPDYAPARQLLAYASVVDGDHETSRLMLDVQTEAAPRNAAAHAESARAFEAAGDAVRACAHYRALAELAPLLSEASEQAQSCWDEILGHRAKAPSKDLAGKAGQLEIEVKCGGTVSAQDCPSPVVVTPDGAVVSPWTPGTGRGSRSRISLEKLRTGEYFVLVLGGSPQARGQVSLIGRHENQTFTFQGGGMHTVAKTTVNFW
jgi:hypothetical protein